ncbi:YwdI family protein [Bacillus sp. FJAT-50079]|uniref:YwdI family protein n=1 Tax=Bacillus sp. FJAT-50079 TaxID=2833577 RepID=UPI001BC94833|nr:YwdI family protein [Bacillus sp. FJAT-50079]MBS4206843.1 YwdI family protein [Bacillus sp. FJAT-50079]
MNVSYEKLFEKMELELRKAKATRNKQQLQGHMHVIKALAEVMLEEDKSEKVALEQQPFVPQVVPSPIPTVTGIGEKTLETDDGANGDSLFDF